MHSVGGHQQSVGWTAQKSPTQNNNLGANVNDRRRNCFKTHSLFLSAAAVRSGLYSQQPEIDDCRWFIAALYLVIASGTSAIIKPRLHDTTGCQTGCTTGMTTGCIVYTNIYPVLKRV